ASFLRKDGGVWSTDKDGLIPALLAAEMTARTGSAWRPRRQLPASQVLCRTSLKYWSNSSMAA
ncbi:hypothetical protein ACQKQA_30380, partial [Pseudomonas sp. NPDC089530]|uniref:hypothetical protein n=1 Tax=Pseudomonas sp. NPDC089530 TaxID=3390651 RepID=UPI003CFEB969